METGRRKRRTKPLSKKHKFIKDGLFFAELNDYFTKELSEEGYAGCEVRVTPKSTEVIIHATKNNKVVGSDGRRIKELTNLIERRFQFPPGTINIYVQNIKNRGLSALSQAEAVRYRLFDGLSVRRACYSVLKWIMDRGAKGCEVIVSGKLRGQRAKSMKFREGYMIHAGDATNYYLDTAIKHVHLRQGVMGIQVKIMLPHKDDGKGGGGVDRYLPDTIKILDLKAIESSDQTEQDRGKLSTSLHQQQLNQDFRQPQQQFQSQQLQQQNVQQLPQQQFVSQQSQQQPQQFQQQFQSQYQPQYQQQFQQQNYQQYDNNQEQQSGFQQYQ